MHVEIIEPLPQDGEKKNNRIENCAKLHIKQLKLNKKHV